MKGVFQFIDYRKFLESYYHEQKKRKRNFSYRFFAQKAGITSPSFLKAVIDGKRNLTSRVIEKFCRALELNDKESKYFASLVHFNQAKTAGEKQEFYALLRSMSGGVQEKILKAGQYDYFDKWYNPILRELICLYDFQDDHERIAKSLNPPITPSEVKKGIQLMMKLGLVDRKGDGTYMQTGAAISADDSITSLALRSFMSAILDHAKLALHEIDKSERHISNLTLGVSPACYDILVAEMKAFKDRVKAIVSRDEHSSRVYHLTLGLFPASRNMKSALKTTAGKGLES